MSGLVLTAKALLARLALNLPERVQRAIVRRPIVIDGLTMATETQLLLKLQKLGNEPGLAMVPLAQARPAADAQAMIASAGQPIGALREVIVDGAAGPMASRLYIPSSRLGADPIPTLLFFHGGGHAIGSLDSHDGACRFMAEASGVQILSIDYRLAPEHPFPAAVDDCFAAYQWLVRNVDSLNADPSRLAVGGDSAGGNLAAATAIQAAESGLPLAFQLLIYPVTDFVNRAPSRDLLDERGFYLEREGMAKLRDWYLPEGTDRAHPLASVLLRDGFPAGLAPAFVATAGFDPLRDEGEAYARKLAEAGVQVEAKRYPAMIHTFWNMVSLGRETRAASADVAEKLKTALA